MVQSRCKQATPHGLCKVDCAARSGRKLRTRAHALQGTGGFGAVYEATWRGQRVAVKKLPNLGADQPSGESMYAALLREIELASKFSSDRWAADRWIHGWGCGGGTVAPPA